MPTPADIISYHREHLVRRLTSRSPLLRFKPAKTGRILDIHNLFQDVRDLPINPADAAQAPLCQDADTLIKTLLGSVPALARIQGTPKGVVARCLRNTELNRDYYHTTGNWALYLGYPLLFWRKKAGDDSRPFWAPLFFWKINLRKERGGKLLIWRPDESSPEKNFDQNDEPEAPIFNRFLASIIAREIGVTIALPDTVENENLPCHQIPQVVEQLLSGWRDCERQIGEETLPFAEPGVGAPDAAVYPYAALGFGQFKGQSILEDLDQLEGVINNNPENCGCLDLFVKPRGKEADAAVSEPAEYGRIAVAESDPSQDRTIWQSRQSRLTVLQGPPGTGKSQTIVNLIANALVRGERIAVVCHHDAALNIVMKRLRAHGLGGLAVKIGNPQSDRKRIIKAIREIASEEASQIFDGNERRRTCSSIEQSEELVEDVFRKLCGTPDETPYGELLARFDAIKENTRIDFRMSNRNPLIAHEKFENIKNIAKADAQARIISNYCEHYEHCDYQNNYWREIKTNDPDDDEIRVLLDELIDDCAGITRESLHDDGDRWFAEHSLMTKHYPGLSVTPAVQQKYADWRDKAREHLSQFLPASAIDSLCADYLPHGKAHALEKCRTQLDTIYSLLQVKEILARDQIIQLLHEYLKHQNGNWVDYFLAATIYTLQKQRKLTRTNVSRAKDAIEELRKQLKKKRKSDVAFVLDRFPLHEKKDAHQNLQDQRMLFLRRSRNAPRATLRKIYRCRFEEDVSRIYPVLLTHPDSACQILPLTAGLFDLLIIDEASQMFTSDALSLLYRAKRVVISGDEMQMPPSDFFMLADDDMNDNDRDVTEENDEDTDANRLIPAEGEPGLLAAANYAIAVIDAPNRKTLEVHYRSMAKELIDFSNRAFYKGRLEVPPSNKPLPPFLSRPIDLREEDGKFENGINPVEIKAIIQALKEIWINEGAVKKHSVGVIVFNTRQRDELLDALEEEGRKSDAFRARLDQARKLERNDEFEGFFVRSVEHVQGDERDIIILATTYDKRSNRFGQINVHEKGRRRLNVAVTRAKRGMIVITSLDISRISHHGEAEVNDESKEAKERWFFWLYMRYAHAVSKDDKEGIKAVFDEIGKFSGDSPLNVGSGEPENLFEESVANAIRARGFHVDYQIGESGFRIDLGVKQHPDDKNYLCGIECDGPHHRHWRARYRDIWRQEILEDKGWKIERVWSTDWFHNKQAELQRLLDKMELLI